MWLQLAFRAGGEKIWRSVRAVNIRIFSCSTNQRPSGPWLELLLETVLRNGRFACVVVSHDPLFLEMWRRDFELNRIYETVSCGAR